MEGKTSRTRNKAVWGTRSALGVLATLVLLASASCGTQVRQGDGSSYLILNSLTGTSGAKPGPFTSTLLSDVVTVVDGVSSTFNDPGKAVVQLAMKDPLGNAPTTNNFITVTQYHVEYVRTDGHNIQGVDVPYAFDGALTETISGTSEMSFTLVRHAAKE